MAAPSVITQNGIVASASTSDFLMSVTGLLDEVPLEWTKTYPKEGTVAVEVPRRDLSCAECSVAGGAPAEGRRRLSTRTRA